MNSNDIVNQITLNCLISKTQLMRINSTKNKKNLDAERNAKIKKYKNHFINIFEDLLDKNEHSKLLDDDIKYSFTGFIDKIIIYLDKNYDDFKINGEENIISETTDDALTTIKKSTSEEDSHIDKINDMMDKCYNDRYYELIAQEEEQEREQEQEEEGEIDDDENDEYDEY